MKVLNKEISECENCPHSIWDYQTQEHYCRETNKAIPSKGIENSCPLPDKEEPKPFSSAISDLRVFTKKIEKLFADEFCAGEKPSMVIAFTVPPEYNFVHYMSNVTRSDGIKLLQATAERMIAQTN